MVGRVHEDVEFAVLGPLEVRAGEVRLRLGGPIPIRILTALLLEPGRIVPVSRLVEAAWDEDPPATAAHQVRKAVAELRQRIPQGPSVIVTDGPGYRVEIGPDQLDLSKFSLWLQQAREALDSGLVPEAAERLRSALALWRGPVTTGNSGSVIAAASAVLEERRLAAVRQLGDLRLAMGEAEELIGDLRELAAEHPLRESFRGQLMLALYRAGRQAEALDEYARMRTLLAEELGIDPGRQLSELHEAILRGSPELAAPRPAETPKEPATPEQPHRPATVQAAPCTLPYDLADFTGRDSELRRLLRHADIPDDGTVRIVTIDGMGGSGKTALAVRAAHRLTDAYPDGQLYADLRGFTPGERPRQPGTVVGTLLRTLGVPGERIPDDSDGRIALWRSVLAERRILLVLDNAADAAQVWPLLPASSGCLVLITSRNRLVGLDGADSISLGLLSSSESRDLVAAALGEERTGNEPEAVEALVELCGHLPLALRIAAARLRSRPRWTVRYLVDRLGDESQRLDELRSGDRSVEATLHLSYQAMDENHRKSFRLLCLHPGTEVEVYSAAALLGTEPRTAEDVLEHLMDMHLVEQHEIGRYSFHDLVRHFAQRLGEATLTADTEQAAFERLLDHYLAVTEEACRILYPGREATDVGRGTAPSASLPALTALAGSDEAEAFFDREHVTLLTAIERAERRGLHHHAVHLARNLLFHLNTRSRLQEYHQAAALAVSAARQLQEPGTLSLSLLNLSVVLWKLGRFREGITVTTEALDIARELGDRGDEAACLDTLGLLHSCLGHLTQARRHLEQAVQLYGSMAAGRQEGYACCNLSTVYTWLGRHREAAANAGRAVLLSRAYGAHGEEITALTDLAIAQLAMGEVEQARTTVEQAVELGDENRMPEDLALALAVAADACQRLGEPHLATTRAERSLALIRSCGMTIRQAAVENILGQVHCRGGDHGQALELHRSAHQHAQSIGYRIEIVRALDGMADALEALGDQAQAQTHRRHAKELFSDMQA